MASEQAKPIKGILKNSTSFEKADSSENRRDMKWDEMNILATYHPEGKEYGHMKIDEPPTPYAEMAEDEEGAEGEAEKEVDPEALMEKLQSTSKITPTVADAPEDGEESSEEEEEPMTSDEKEKKKQFELKRKLHYNEFMAVKLGRQLIDEDDDDEEEEEKKAAEPEKAATETDSNEASTTSEAVKEASS